MPLLPIPEFKPDLTDLDGNSTQTLLNVLPQADGYGPAKDFSVYSAALPAANRGFFYGRNADGTITVFAGTSTKIFKLNNTDFTWIPVSKVVAVTTISNASPAVVSLNSHGQAIGDAVVFSTTSALPTGLTAGTVYYVIAAGFTANAFEVSLTPAGAAINTSSAGSGTHSITSSYTALPAGDQWQFAQFNNTVIATQINTAPQAFDLAAGAAFADLAGSPPQARYVAVVGFFIVLSGLGSSTPYRVQWSGLEAITTWTPGTNFSDYQDLPDGGIVRGVAGGEYGVISQDAALRRMIYLPGSATVFQIERISEEKGILAPLSITRSGERVFYMGTDGYKMLMPGAPPAPVGKERVDRFLLGDIDTANLQLCIGASDPKGSRVFLAYKSLAGSVGLFDKLLCYDWAIDRFALITMSGEYISSLARPGVTLEGLDAISGSIDALTFSLDDISTAAFSQLAGFNSAHKLGFYAGANLEATLVSSERSGDGRRLRVKGFRPVTDAASVYGSTSIRELASATPTFTAETAMNAIGYVKQNVSTRYAKGKVRIPAGTAWTYVKGIEPDVTAEGRR